jgi:hypothetical protein
MSASPHNPYTRLWDADNGETYYEHRRVAEEKLGRPLRAGEVVHHEDQNKNNNHPDNIVIFSSQRAHMLYENYYLRERAGVKHLFTIEEWLMMHGHWFMR